MSCCLVCNDLDQCVSHGLGIWLLFPYYVHMGSIWALKIVPPFFSTAISKMQQETTNPAFWGRLGLHPDLPIPILCGSKGCRVGMLVLAKGVKWVRDRSILFMSQLLQLIPEYIPLITGVLKRFGEIPRFRDPLRS